MNLKDSHTKISRSSFTCKKKVTSLKQTNKGQLNLSVNEINSIVDISKILFQNLVFCHQIAKSL